MALAGAGTDSTALSSAVEELSLFPWPHYCCFQIHRLRDIAAEFEGKNKWRKDTGHFSSSSLPQFLHQEIKKIATSVVSQIHLFISSK